MVYFQKRPQQMSDCIPGESADLSQVERVGVACHPSITHMIWYMILLRRRFRRSHTEHMIWNEIWYDIWYDVRSAIWWYDIWYNIWLGHIWHDIWYDIYEYSYDDMKYMTYWSILIMIWRIKSTWEYLIILKGPPVLHKLRQQRG